MLLVRPETPAGGSCKAKAFQTAGNLISSLYLAPDIGLNSRHLLTIQLSEGETARGTPHMTWPRFAESAVQVLGSAFGLEHVPDRWHENARPVNVAKWF